MYFFIVGILILLTLIMHETGHALAMYAKRVPIEEMGLGINIPFIPHFRRVIKIISAAREDRIVFTINPLLIGAYVRPTAIGEEKIEKLSYSDRAVIYGAGILGNILFFLVLYIILLSTPPGHDLTKPIAYAFIAPTILIFFVFWKARRTVCMYLIPILGILTALFIFVSIILLRTGAVYGPIGIGQSASQEVTGFEGAFSFGAAISLGIGLFNALPLFPLDGGRIIDALIEEFGKGVRTVYQSISAICLIMIVVLAFWGDIVRIF